jgi:hypothetical protein
MITILGALVGLIPSLFKSFQQYHDNKQELAIMQIQMQIMQIGLKTQLQEVAINAQSANLNTMYSNMKVNIPIIDGINALIRPMIAIIYTIRMIMSITHPDLVNLLDHDYGIYACIISFYFGGVISNR